MNELIEKNISWDLVRRYASGEPEAEIEDAFIEKETGALTVVIGLNFVVPAQDEKRLRLAIAKVLPQARGARIRYDYRTKEMALTEDGTAVLFAQRLLAEDVPAGRHVGRHGGVPLLRADDDRPAQQAVCGPDAAEAL